MTVTTISPEQLHEKLSRGEAIELIDVRTPVEFREVHATVARNIPLDRLNPNQVVSQRNGAASLPVYLICKGGSRGARAAQMFVDAGHGNVVNVDGGTDAWASAGLPVLRGKKAISLERQVRIVAGFAVLISALLGILIHPYFAGLAAFMGAGLMFAGITDTCAMGMLIAKMPWNQISSEPVTRDLGCPTNGSKASC